MLCTIYLIFREKERFWDRRTGRCLSKGIKNPRPKGEKKGAGINRLFDRPFEKGNKKGTIS